MNAKDRSLLKKIAIDVAGVGLIIASPFLGLFPGPGGVPIFFAGLGLLASNHTWARNILKDLEKHREGLAERVFANKKVSITADIIGTFILCGALYVLFTTDSLLYRGFSIGTISTTLLVLLSNQSRIERIIAAYRKSKH